MNSPTPSTAPRLHPLVATAAVAVTVFSLAGIAALTGVLPMGKSAAPVEAPAIVTPAPTAPTTAVPPAPTLATAPVVEKIVVVEQPAPQPAPRPAVKPVAKKKAPAPVAEPAPVVETRPAPAVIAAPPAPPAPPPCLNCGVVDNLREVAQPGEASGLGAVAGGVVGGLLGNQVGGGSGKKIATVLGAAGGAYAGHQIEKSRNKSMRYEIDVRMTDGTVRTLVQDTVPAWRIGDRVKIENNALVTAD